MKESDHAIESYVYVRLWNSPSRFVYMDWIVKCQSLFESVYKGDIVRCPWTVGRDAGCH